MIEVPDNDIEYYERKVVRMEQDICLLQEELNRVRLRLRTAEDFQIKYRILIKNNDVDLQRARIETARTEENRSKEKVAFALKENDERWTKVKQTLEQDLRKEADERMAKLTDDLENANRRIKDLSHKKEEMELFSFKIRKFEKENEALSTQLAGIKTACEKQKNQELAALRNQLNVSFRERLTNERQSNQTKISSLTKQLAETQVQQDIIQLKLPELSNAELIALKDLYANAKSSHQKEISEFEDIIMRKNTEIKALIRDQSESQEKFQEILSNKIKACSVMEEEVTRIRKEHQEEVLEITKRSIASKEAEVELLKEQLKNLTDFCRYKESQLSKEQQVHRQELQSLAETHHQQILRLNEDSKQLQREAGDLAAKLKEKEEKIADLNSQISAEKSRLFHANGQQAGEYENGIVFLERQLRRSEQRIQEKTRLYAKLQTDLQHHKKDYEGELARIHELLKAERRESEQKTFALQNQVRDLTDQLITKSKEVTQCKQSFLSQKLELEVQVRSLRAQLQELEGDYDRLQESKKQLGESLRAQRERGWNVPIMKEGSISSLQNDLEAIYREKQDRLLRKEEESKRAANDELKNLRQRVNGLDIENGALKRTQQRLSSEIEFNKENGRADQEKKIAAIDLELALMSNIYHEFMNSSSRNAEPSLQGRLGVSRLENGELPSIF